MPMLALNVENKKNYINHENNQTFVANSKLLSLAERFHVFIWPIIVYYYYANIPSTSEKVKHGGHT